MRCALVLLLVLLLQPVLCVVSCGFHTQPAAERDTASAFLCGTPQPGTAPSLPIPAFWPGVLPILFMFTLSVSIGRLALPALRCPSAHPWAPPLPPPRAACV